MNEVYVLMEDQDLTMRSSPEPVGYAVSSEEEAKQWSNEGQFRCFSSVVIMGTAEEVDREIKKESDRRHAEFEAVIRRREYVNKEELKARLERDAELINGRTLLVMSPQQEIDLADRLLSGGKSGCDLTSLDDDRASVECLDAGMQLSKKVDVVYKVER